VGDDERSNLPELDVPTLDVNTELDEHGSFFGFRGRRYERPPSGAGRDGRERTAHIDASVVTPNPRDVPTLDVPEEHFAISEEQLPTPYVTIVFAHCSFNLYHHPGVLGCRRSSPANERARVEQVRDALVAAREAARASQIESRTHSEAGHTSHTSHTSHNLRIARSASKHTSLLEHAAHVTARATSTLPRLAARAACEAVSFSLERSVEKRFPNVADAGASAAARALETALEALRSPELRSSLAFLRADDVCARASSDDERDEKTQALLDDARAFAALARDE
jgi:hypothetical protein